MHIFWKKDRECLSRLSSNEVKLATICQDDMPKVTFSLIINQGVDGDGTGVTPSEPVEANRRVRARVRAAGKALEGLTGKWTIHQL